MQHIQQSDERYTDLEGFVIMTRTKVFTDMPCHLGTSSEDIVSSTNSIDLDDRRIAETPWGWSYSFAPVRIGAISDY
jgi:hypothetical protein